MAKTGRKPKPTHLKLLQGNPGGRPLNKQEPKPGATTLACPTWLHPYAKQEWKRIAADLKRSQLLTKVDRQMLAGYCQAYARWREAEKAIAKHGMIFTTVNGYIQQRPEVSIANTALKEMRVFGAEFGMTPSARSGIHVPNEKPRDEAEEDFFGKRQKKA